MIKSTNTDISTAALLAALRTDEDNEAIEDIAKMRDEAAKVARPLALYAPFTPVAEDGVITINDVVIEDPFVYEMLSECEIVVPYAATCGTELDEWAGTFSDIYEQYIADTLKAMYMSAVQEKLLAEVKEKFFKESEYVSSLNPGSLSEWPIMGQEQLFRILGGVTGDIGIVLTSSFLMIPNKSISGIYFGSEQMFHNCQLCPRADCPGRRAPYTG